METGPLDVLCIGHASFDLVFSVPHHPSPDEKTVASAWLGCGGGPAANAAVAVSRLGGRAAFAGYLAMDPFGDQHATELVSDGVDLGNLVRGEAPTPLSAILVKPDGQRTVVNYRAATPPLPAGALRLPDPPPRLVLMDGLEPLASPAIARQARQLGIPTLLDAGSHHAGTAALAPLVEYLVCSEKFASQYTGEAEPEAALRVLAATAPVVVITLGSRGLIWRRAGQAGRLPAFDVQAVDTTGAGDAFHGALALCLARGQSSQASLTYASAVAALTCTRIGARPALPTEGEVDRFLARKAAPTAEIDRVA